MGKDRNPGPDEALAGRASTSRASDRPGAADERTSGRALTAIEALLGVRVRGRPRALVVQKVVTADAFERELDGRSWAGRFVRAIAERFRDVDGQLAEARGRRRQR